MSDDWEWNSDDGPKDDSNVHLDLKDKGLQARSKNCTVYYDLLKDFQLDLADNQILDKLNDRLSKTIFQDFMTYYFEAGVSLAHYTIETELKRMQFVCKYNGRTFYEHDEILTLYQSMPLHDLWKLANQSVYAPMVQVVHNAYVRQLFVSIGIILVLNS